MRNIIMLVAAIALATVPARSFAEPTEPQMVEVVDAPSVDGEAATIDGTIDSDAEAVEAVEAIIEAASTGRWVVFAAGLMSLLSWATTRFKLLANAGHDVRLAVSLASGVIGGMAVGLLSMGDVTLGGIITTFIEAFIAAGGVVMIGDAFKRARD